MKLYGLSPQQHSALVMLLWLPAYLHSEQRSPLDQDVDRLAQLLPLTAVSSSFEAGLPIQHGVPHRLSVMCASCVQGQVRPPESGFPNRV